MRPARAALALALAAALLLPATSRASEVSSARLRDVSLLLQRLCEVAAVSGHEAPMTRRVRSLLPQGMQGAVDAKGNLVVELGQGGPELTFIAHMDEIGYEVKGVEADGRVTVVRKGGFLDYLYEAHPVVIWTAGGPVNAVVAPRSAWLDGNAKDAFGPEDVRLDVGTDSWAATGALGIRVGDYVTVAKRYVRLGRYGASARSMDDRVGCAALLLALKDLEGARLSRKVRFVFSVEEEIGLDGAEAAARQEPGAVCFAIDTFVSSDSPLESPRYADAPLGQGCVVRAIDQSAIAARRDVERVMSLAREHHVDIQKGLTGGGNDGSKYVVEGAADVPLGWPLRYSHSAAEVVDLRDVDALAELVALLAERY